MEFVKQQFRETKELMMNVDKQIEDINANHKYEMTQKDQVIEGMEAKIKGQIEQINKLASEIALSKEEDNEKYDRVMKLEQAIDEKDQMIDEYRQQIWELKEELMNKEQVIEALSNSLGHKGEEAA